MKGMQGITAKQRLITFGVKTKNRFQVLRPHPLHPCEIKLVRKA